MKVICIKNYKHTGFDMMFFMDNLYDADISKDMAYVCSNQYLMGKQVSFGMSYDEFYEHFKVLADYREEQINNLLIENKHD